jgi:hypothetical protein
MSSSYADVVISLLTPPPPATPADGFARVDVLLDRGVPHRMTLDAEHDLVVLVPTGVAVDWRDADPAEPVSAAADDRAARAAEPDVPVGALRRPPARLVVVTAGTVAATAPLVASGPRRCARVDVQVLDWDLRAGALRGPGDGLSRLSLAWRRNDRGTTTFAPPPIPERVAKRHPPEQRMQSTLDGSHGSFPWSKGKGRTEEVR